MSSEDNKEVTTIGEDDLAEKKAIKQSAEYQQAMEKVQKHPKGRIRNKIILVVVLILLVFAVFRIVSSKMDNPVTADDDTVNIKVTTAAITSLENTSPLTGRIKAVEEATIIPKMPGEVTAVYVSMGDKVGKGTVLFTVDATQTAGSYDQAQIACNMAQDALKNAETNLNRMNELYAQGAISLQQQEQAQTAYTSAQQSVLQAQNSLRLAADAVNNSTVTSPISGYVTSLNVAQGGMASQAAPAATIANIDKLEIDTSISEQLINKVQVGDQVQVIVDSVSDQELTGTVSALSPAPATGTLTYPMKVTLNQSVPTVKPGMFAQIIVTSEKNAGVLAIPSNAVLIKSGKTVVATIQDGKVVLQEVTAGIDNGVLVEIKDGLQAGQTIVIEGQSYLEEDSKFEVIDENGAASSDKSEKTDTKNQKEKTNSAE